MAVREDDTIADARSVCAGGETAGETVPRGFLHVALNTSRRCANESGRRELADWIASAGTVDARVFVNRVWAWLFGSALCAPWIIRHDRRKTVAPRTPRSSRHSFVAEG